MWHYGTAFFHLSIAFFSLSLRSKPSMRTKIAWFCNKNKFCIDTWVLLGELSFDWSVSLYVQHTRAYHVNFTNIGHGNDFYVINTFLFAFFSRVYSPVNDNRSSTVVRNLYICMTFFTRANWIVIDWNCHYAVAILIMWHFIKRSCHRPNARILTYALQDSVSKYLNNVNQCKQNISIEIEIFQVFDVSLTHSPSMHRKSKEN